MLLEFGELDALVKECKERLIHEVRVNVETVLDNRNHGVLRASCFVVVTVKLNENDLTMVTSSIGSDFVVGGQVPKKLLDAQESEEKRIIDCLSKAGMNVKQGIWRFPEGRK